MSKVFESSRTRKPQWTFVARSGDSANSAGDAGENCVGIRANQPDCSDYDQQNYSHHYSVLCNVLAILGPESQKSLVHGSAFRCLRLKSSSHVRNSCTRLKNSPSKYLRPVAYHRTGLPASPRRFYLLPPSRTAPSASALPMSQCSGRFSEPALRRNVESLDTHLRDVASAAHSFSRRQIDVQECGIIQQRIARVTTHFEQVVISRRITTHVQDHVS
jgi:hypothetical protein